MNAPASPSRMMIVGVDQWAACCSVSNRPPREGHCTIGLDLGGSSSHDRRLRFTGRKAAAWKPGALSLTLRV